MTDDRPDENRNDPATGFDRQIPGNTPVTSHGSSGEQGPGQPSSGDRVVGVQGPGHPEAANVDDPPTPAHGVPLTSASADQAGSARAGSESGRSSAGLGFGVGELPGAARPGSGNEWARPAQSGWTPSGEQRVLFGSAAPGAQGAAGAYAGQQTYGSTRHDGGQPPYRYAGHDEPKKRSGGLIAGVTVLALLVGGAAGAAGGYLVADTRAPSSASALDLPKPAKQASTPAPAGSVEAVAAKVLPSVVQLQVRGRSSAGEGSGFVISEDGLIVTNNHVIEGAADGGQITAVFQDGRTARATIVGRDPTSDVAVVKAQDIGGLVVAELGRSDDLAVGQAVVAIGSPFELSGTVTSGIVSALQRPTRAGGADGSQATVLDAVQTDAAINPGNSGGPLANMQGQVIGINSAIYSPGSGSGDAGSVGIGFAIPIDQARRTADEIVDTGKATQTVLGVTVRDNPQGTGALINEVVAGGAGEQAGIKSGDIVTQLGDRRIDGADALVAAVRSKAPGDTVSLVIGDGERTVEATLGGQPVETG